MLVVLIISIVLTFFLPILSLPLNFVGMIFSKGKIRKCYAFLLALSLAFIAFVWVPKESMDLFRYQQQMKIMTGHDIWYYSSNIKELLEPAHHIIKYLVAQTGNYNLLQFVIVLAGYFSLFWLICDFAELKGVKRGMFTLLSLFVFSAVRFIDFASGLWFNYAIINTGIGIYLAYFRKTKYLQYVFYVFAICLHIGVLYINVIVLLLSKVKLFKRLKLSASVVVVMIASFFSVSLAIVNNLFGAESTIAIIANNMFNEYFVNWSDSGGLDFSLRIIMIVFSLIASYWYLRRNSLKEYGCFVFYFSSFIIVTTICAPIFARYSFLAAILSAPMIYSLFEQVKDKQKRLLFFGVISLMILANCSSAIKQMYVANLEYRLKANLAKPLVIVMKN